MKHAIPFEPITQPPLKEHHGKENTTAPEYRPTEKESVASQGLV